MQPPLDDSQPLVIKEFAPGVKRAILLAAGLACVVLPFWDLRHAFAQFGWWTVFCGVIVLGALVVGLTSLLGAIASETLEWHIHDRVLTLTRTSPLRQRTETIRARDVARTEIRTIDWDGGPNTYSVVLHLKSGRPAETPPVATRAAAEALQAQIRTRLGLE